MTRKLFVLLGLLILLLGLYLFFQGLMDTFTGVWGLCGTLLCFLFGGVLISIGGMRTDEELDASAAFAFENMCKFAELRGYKLKNGAALVMVPFSRKLVTRHTYRGQVVRESESRFDDKEVQVWGATFFLSDADVSYHDQVQVIKYDYLYIVRNPRNEEYKVFSSK